MINKIILLLMILISIIINSQVGINTTTPTETLDVNGTLRIRNINENNCVEWILVADNSGVIKKMKISELLNICPTLDRNQSNGNYLLFYSNSSIPNPNNLITINNINFISSGSWISNNIYYFSFTKINGSTLNLNKNFTVFFDNLKCTY